MLRSLTICATFIVLLLLARPAAAQVQRIEDAELIFQQAVEAFDEGDYGMAYRRFRLVFDTYTLNPKTTAAYLMAGKSLYRDGRHREAADLLTAFIRRFPTSSYLGEAQRTLDLALQQLEREGQRPATIALGIALPLGSDDVGLTQALFNGIRLAVDEVNESGAAQVRMVFRDTRGTADGAAQAVRALAEEGVDVVVGPLYSQEARAAGAAAERAGVVLVAPLATDEDVAEGRRFVFQANPTITSRGERMAHFAMRELGLDRLGVVAERDAGSISERMGEGFQKEVVLQGGELAFFELLENARGWAQLDQRIGADTLAAVQAVYLPVAGNRVDALIEAALQSLERTGAAVQVLGNAEWHNFRNRQLASRYEATYTNDFYVDPGRAGTQDFMRRYREVAGSMPDAGSVRSRLAYTGYDLARYLLGLSIEDAARPLREALHAAPRYQGLGIRVHFGDGNVNRALYVMRYRDGERQVVE